MVFGAHVIVYSKDAAADRAFFRDVLGFESVDAGHDWLIFGLPPAEMAVHPAEGGGHELYFLCDDLAVEIAALSEKGVQCSEVEEARWGGVSYANEKASVAGDGVQNRTETGFDSFYKPSGFSCSAAAPCSRACRWTVC
jgi:catechol 2,3-dioxygenase-like lactoylglutathione lyase family enzyme